MSAKPTPEEYRKTREAFRRLSEKIDEVQVSAGFPMATPRRGKRLPAWVDTLEGPQAFAAAVAGMSNDMNPAFRQFMVSLDELEEMLVNAVLSGDSTILFNVAEAVKAAREQHLTVFTKHVAAVLQAKREIFAMTGSVPIKSTVREQAEKILAAKGMKAENIYTGEERWKEVFSAANQKDLPQLRRPRGKSKHGDLPTKPQTNRKK